METVCGYCGKPGTKRCSGCKQQVYCSRECQVTHYKAHKYECRLMRVARRTQTAEDASSMCLICFEPLDDGTKHPGQIPHKLVCGHTFHSSCIQKWKRQKASAVNSCRCPACRTWDGPPNDQPWYARPAWFVVNQALGFVFQSMNSGTKSELEEWAYLKQCKDACIKDVGLPRFNTLMKTLDIKLKEFPPIVALVNTGKLTPSKELALLKAWGGRRCLLEILVNHAMSKHLPRKWTKKVAPHISAWLRSTGLPAV